MRAVVITKHGPPEVLQVQERPDPHPRDGQVLIDVKAAGINFADTMARVGLYPEAPKPPCVVGYEVAGTRADTGERVMAGTLFNGYAERVAANADDILPLPDALSFEQGAAIPVNYATAWQGLLGYGPLGAGDRVLIHAAAGGVGHLAVQIARERGAEVIATCSAANLDFVRGIGASEVIAYDQAAFDERVRDVDVVFDVIGGDVHARSYKVLKRGGVMACLAAAPFQDQGAAHGVEVRMARVMPDPAALSAVVALAGAGRLNVCVDHVLRLADFAKAQTVSQGGHARGKTVITLAS